ncbi:hypothetical protein EV356DRAFT_339113 [Viridothelium virens]|uniref:Uncharacterized protein n=1 Tax=Viridothelium virens TaxID=1048519 RepID=A0A6A6HJ55_VIRVR|nr:hypothetical protein EV356DRAFT_339113 [Viridothelium virens]
MKHRKLQSWIGIPIRRKHHKPAHRKNSPKIHLQGIHSCISLPNLHLHRSRRDSLKRECCKGENRTPEIENKGYRDRALGVSICRQIFEIQKSHIFTSSSLFLLPPSSFLHPFVRAPGAPIHDPGFHQRQPSEPRAITARFLNATPSSPHGISKYVLFCHGNRLFPLSPFLPIPSSSSAHPLDAPSSLDFPTTGAGAPPSGGPLLLRKSAKSSVWKASRRAADPASFATPGLGFGRFDANTSPDSPSALAGGRELEGEEKSRRAPPPERPEGFGNCGRAVLALETEAGRLLTWSGVCMERGFIMGGCCCCGLPFGARCVVVLRMPSRGRAPFWRKPEVAGLDDGEPGFALEFEDAFAAFGSAFFSVPLSLFLPVFAWSFLLLLLGDWAPLRIGLGELREGGSTLLRKSIRLSSWRFGFPPGGNDVKRSSSSSSSKSIA